MKKSEQQITWKNPSAGKEKGNVLPFQHSDPLIHVRELKPTPSGPPLRITQVSSGFGNKPTESPQMALVA